MKQSMASVLLLLAQSLYSSGWQATPAELAPPGHYKIISENGKVRIPFEMFRNKIRMAARVNDKDCYLTIDNGSLWDELLFFGSPKTDSLALKYSGETVIGDVQAPNPIKAYTVADLTVGFKDVVFTGQSAIITSYDRNRPNLWEGIDGQVSATFFKHFVVKINFDESFIELIRPKEFNPPLDGEILAMRPGPNNSRTIQATIKTLKGPETLIDLLIDIGGIYPLYLPVGKFESIQLPPNAVATELGSGLMRQNGFLGRVHSISLGRYTLRDVVTAFIPVAKDADIFGNTMIGLPLLQRFNVAFDYPQSRLILEPSKAFHGPFL